MAARLLWNIKEGQNSDLRSEWLPTVIYETWICKSLQISFVLQSIVSYSCPELMMRYLVDSHCNRVAAIIIVVSFCIFLGLSHFLQVASVSLGTLLRRRIVISLVTSSFLLSLFLSFQLHPLPFVAVASSAPATTSSTATSAVRRVFIIFIWFYFFSFNIWVRYGTAASGIDILLFFFENLLELILSWLLQFTQFKHCIKTSILLCYTDLISHSSE